MYCMGGEENREFGVVPTSCSQIVHRSAGAGVAVREPVGAGSTNAGVGSVVATLTVDSPEITFVQLQMCRPCRRVPSEERLR